MMFKKIFATTMLFAMATSSHAASVNGDVKFSVNIPEIIVLYHWDTATLNLTSNNGIHKPNGTGTKSDDLNAGTYELEGTLTTDDPLASIGQGGKIQVKLLNSWGVRSITNSNPTLTLTAPGATLTKNGGTETLSIVNTATDKPVLKCSTAGDCANDGTASTTVTKGWGVKTGNIEFKLDLSNVTAAGTYSTGGNNGNTFNLQFQTN